jgi:regulator of RNase E activity RraA
MSDVAAKEGRCYIVMGYNAWGRAGTVKQALDNWRKNASFLQEGKEVSVVVIDADADADVDDMGAIITPAGKEHPFKVMDMKVSLH